MSALADAVAAAERKAVLEALRATRGHRGQAAERLGVSRSTLERRMRALWSADELAALDAAEGWPARGGASRGRARGGPTDLGEDRRHHEDLGEDEGIF
jgi:hypothetical protein